MTVEGLSPSPSRERRHCPIHNRWIELPGGHSRACPECITPEPTRAQENTIELLGLAHGAVSIGRVQQDGTVLVQPRSQGCANPPTGRAVRVLRDGRPVYADEEGGPR